MTKRILLLIIAVATLIACTEDLDDNISIPFNVSTSFNFTHNWDGVNVANTDFNTIQYTNQNGEMLSIERLRYVISNVTFTNINGDVTVVDGHNLVDLTTNSNLEYVPEMQIATGTYANVSFTFGFKNEDNIDGAYPDLNSASFNVPMMLGGGYHYMQFDGKFINNSSNEQGFNYHAIRAVDNPGSNPTFPQDTFITVNLGPITISNSTSIEVKMNIAEWFKNPNTWDLNTYNTVLMPNSAAQIMMHANGQNVFSLGEIN
jgi:hypothetical protein